MLAMAAAITEHLHLLVKHSSMGREEQSSISVSHLAQELHVAAPQQRRIVIFDCCFSEAAATAFGAMDAIDEALAATAIKNFEPGVPPPERGTLLFCSSPRETAYRSAHRMTSGRFSLARY